MSVRRWRLGEQKWSANVCHASSKLGGEDGGRGRAFRAWRQSELWPTPDWLQGRMHDAVVCCLLEASHLHHRLSLHRRTASRHHIAVAKSSSMAANALGSIYKWAVPTALAFSLASSSIYDVKGGSRAVIFDRLRGVSDEVVQEGTHFLIPWLQKAITFDVRTRPRNISTTTGSKDLQMVSLTLRVLHRPDVKALPKIYQVSDANWAPF